MQAVRCREWGPPDVLRLEKVAPRELAPSDVRIRVRAAGVNFADNLMVGGTYQVKLTVTDNTNGTDSVTHAVTVQGPNVPPTALWTSTFGVPCSALTASRVFCSAASSVTSQG